ncbi:MAG: hypothetical protein M3552_05895 [Planctomycetota bacterium]|nr:hypothetical protein [Planctomycetota bacterium]
MTGRSRLAVRIVASTCVWALLAGTVLAYDWLIYYPNHDFTGPISTMESYGGAEPEVNLTVELWRADSSGNKVGDIVDLKLEVSSSSGFWYTTFDDFDNNNGTLDNTKAVAILFDNNNAEVDRKVVTIW